MTGTYRKKPVIIEAIQYHGGNADEIMAWTADHGVLIREEGNAIHSLVIPTLEGDHRADLGDWIINGVAGEFYPCKPAIFEQTYEAVSVGGEAT